MMGFGSWLLSLLNWARDDHAQLAPEDPRETLDRAYQRQLELHGQVRESLAGVTAAKKRDAVPASQRHSTLGRLEAQASAALAEGDEEAASRTLVRRAVLREQLAELTEHRDELAAEESKIRAVQDRLDLEAQRLRSRVEAIKDTYTAAEARARLGDEVTGSGSEDFELRMALLRAQDLVLATRARASAVDRLLAQGTAGSSALAPDPFLRELADSTAEAEARDELARLRAELTQKDPPALESHDE
jgi:phage shock protein A